MTIRLMPSAVDAAYLGRIGALMLRGKEVSPRGMPIREEINARIACPMNDPVIRNTGRALNYRFMAAEAAWILSGSDRLEDIKPFMATMARFSDDGMILRGAYGPPFAMQIDTCVEALVRDLDTRQAVLTIWRRNPDLTSKDIPCTISIQFLIRNNFLHVIANMRSSDVFLGLPYDLFTFSMMGHYLLALLNLEQVRPGNTYINMGSSHMYERDVDRLLDVMNTKDFGENDPISLDISVTSRGFVDALWMLANAEGCGIDCIDQFIPLVEAKGWKNAAIATNP